jgi:DNA-binding beta-propeller fold protein YncE
MKTILKRGSLILTLIISFFIIGCEDETADGDSSLINEGFNISKLDVKSTGDASQSSPELIRFINSSEGVIVNSKQNTIDFFTLTSSEITITGESINITDSDDAECSSIDVSVDESIIAVVVTKGSCERGELYLIDVTTRDKFGPYELGYNPDAVDIAVDNEFVVVVNEYDYEDGTAGCTVPFYPGVTIWDISQGLDGESVSLVKHMKITHTGENGNLAEPEGVKIGPDGETVYMTLQESNQMGWFSILSPPDTLQNYVSFTSEIHEPDGIWVNSAGTVVCTGGEYDGKIGVTLLNSDGTPGEQYYANLADDLPSTWTWTDERKGIEPEEVVIAEHDGKSFVLASLQDPAAVVVYDITDPTNPTWDSGEIVQLVDYSTGEGESIGESEGLAYKNGYVLVSNTADPSVCLLKASWAE